MNKQTVKTNEVKQVIHFLTDDAFSHSLALATSFRFCTSFFWFQFSQQFASFAVQINLLLVTEL